MKKLLSIPALLFALLFASQAQAVGTRPSDMTASGAIVGTQLLWCPTGITADLKCTFTQVDTFINAQFSGDLTVTAGGVVTLKNTGPGATGPLGSATVAPIVTIDAQGRVTALTSATVTPAIGSVTGLGAGVGTFLATATSANLAAALTDETGTGANVFGTAPTISSPTINTAMTLGYAAGGGTQCLQVSNTGAVTVTGAVCGGAGSTGASPTATASDTAVNGVATTFMRSDAAPAIQKASAAQFGLVEVDGTSIISTAGVISFNAPINAQVGTSYTVLNTDKGKVITLTNAAAIAVTIPVASTAGFGSSYYVSIINEGAGLVTLTPTTSTIDGGSSLTLKQFQSVDLITDGTNYFTLRGRPTNVDAAQIAGVFGGSLFGTVSTQSGTTYTLASTDCGTEIAFTNAAAVTVTIPATLTTGCNISILQTTAAGQVTVTGTAVSAATLHSAHSYTKTFGQWAIIGINIETTGVAILTGDGA